MADNTIASEEYRNNIQHLLRDLMLAEGDIIIAEKRIQSVRQQWRNLYVELDDERDKE